MKKLLTLIVLLGLIVACKRDNEEPEIVVPETVIPETEEPIEACDTITCLNDGICENGLCNCAFGYTGDSCEILLPAKSFTITEVKVVHFPFYNVGSEWDVLSSPDIVVSGQPGNIMSTDYWYATTTSYNPDMDDTLVYSGLSWNFPMSDVVTFGMWDNDDEDGFQAMGSKTIVPQNVDGGFPESLVLWNGEVKMFVKVTWNL